MAAQDIIIKPLLSEKSYQGIQSKRYTFVVKKTANKTEIKLAVEEIFGVKVESVNTINVKGKKRRGRARAILPRIKRRSFNSKRTASRSSSSIRCPNGNGGKLKWLSRDINRRLPRAVS